MIAARLKAFEGDLKQGRERDCLTYPLEKTSSERRNVQSFTHGLHHCVTDHNVHYIKTYK